MFLHKNAHQLICGIAVSLAFSPTLSLASSNTKTTQQLSILDVYKLAEKHDAGLAAAKAKLEAKLEVNARTRALFLPKIMLSADSKINDNETENEGFTSPSDMLANIGTGPHHYNSYGYSLSIIQPLLDLTSIYKIPEAKIKEGQAKVSFMLAEQALVARVGTAYIETLMAEEDLLVAYAEKKAIEEQLLKAKLGFELGTATIANTHEAQAARDLVHAGVIASKNKLEVAKLTIITLTGQSNTNLQRVEGALPLNNPAFEVPEFDKLLSVAMQANSSLILAKLNQALAESKLAQAKAGRAPTVNAIAAYGENNANGSAFSPTNSETKYYAAGVELKVPLYTGGALSSGIRSAAADLEAKKQLHTNKKRSIELELQEAALFVGLATSQVQAFSQAVKSSTISLKSTTVGFDLGDRTGLDVLAVQRNHYKAVRDRSNAQYQYLLSVLGLKFSMGILSEADLDKMAEMITDIDDKK